MIRRFHARSLSTKIASSIVLIAVIAFIALFSFLAKINKEAFDALELEKATLIAETIEPLLAMDFFLELDDQSDKLGKKLLDNPNILAVTIIKGSDIVFDEQSPHHKTYLRDSFTFDTPIREPSSGEKMGTLKVVYSSQHFNDLMAKYTTLSGYMLIGMTVMFLIFTFYIRSLLSPLKQMALALKLYRPQDEAMILLPQADQENEIGQIAKAINDMQTRIAEYDKNQKDINAYLEETVKLRTSQLRRQLYTDLLTGLPNRNQLIDHVSKNPYEGLCIINIDDFKEVNDLFGHQAGDTILSRFGANLRRLYEDDANVMLYKLSGDEYALLFFTLDETRLSQSIAHLLAAVEKMHFFHENNDISLRITIGATLNMNAALEKADIALKAAKKQRKHFVVYDEKYNIEAQYQSNLQWVKKLKAAIDGDRIVPYFQPIIDNANGDVSGYECLMRLIDERGQPVGPYSFLDIAKKSRMYTQLTRIMIEKSCRHFQGRDIRFSVNLSVEDILDPDTVAFIVEKINRYGVADRIIFEILESEGIEKYNEVARFIGHMKAMGCKIAVDDFGSGYSNFEHLLQLNIDFIKIDNTLVKNIHTNRHSQIVVETIVDFARKLGIKTVAEFVHSDEVWQKVKGLGVDRSQGFYLGEPAATTR